jgi:hypothetical protein
MDWEQKSAGLYHFNGAPGRLAWRLIWTRVSRGTKNIRSTSRERSDTSSGDPGNALTPKTLIARKNIFHLIAIIDRPA